MDWEFLPDGHEVADAAVWRVVAASRADAGVVLGIATGAALVETCRRLVAACGREGRRLAGATVFALDELVGLPPAHAGSSRSFLARHLLAPGALDPTRTHLPDGWLGGVASHDGHLDGEGAAAIAAECVRYEQAMRAAGGLGLTLAALGSDGQLVYNEPGTPRAARTRVVELTTAHLHAHAPFFAGEQVPRRAITAGIATLLESRAVVLLAPGEERAAAVARLRRGGVDEGFPASALHLHGDVTVLVEGRRPSRPARRPRP